MPNWCWNVATIVSKSKESTMVENEYENWKEEKKEEE